MKRLIYIIMCIFTLTSCSNEDDLDELFYNQTWKIVGAKINGKEIIKDVSVFYKEGPYQMTFLSGTLSGTLSTGNTFTGRWSADGKSRAMQITISNSPSTPTTMDNNVMNIISRITRYKGDCNEMMIIQDDNNYINLSKNGLQ